MKKKKHSSLLTLAVIAVCVALFVVGTVIAQRMAGKLSREITLEEAQTVVDDTLAALPRSVSPGALYIAENSSVTVTDVTYGTEKDAILTCTYTTINVSDVVREHAADYVEAAYAHYISNQESGVKTNATKVKLLLRDRLKADFETAEILTGTVELRLYETEKGVFSLYLSDEAVNTVFGGLLDAINCINAIDTVEYRGETVNIANQNTLRTGIKDCMALNNYDSRKPDTAIPVVKAWNNFKYDFHRNFIQNNQWKYLTTGVCNTLRLTFFSLLIGIFIGFIVAVIRCTNYKTGKLGFLSAICRAYLSMIRGTPLMVQLLIIYFVVLLPNGVERFPASMICFGLNSGAYVSEILRGGILSVDDGQTEAGRSLGLTYMQTMIYIIIPQAFKASLPALVNEFITLLKETSVAFYIGAADLLQGGLKIRSITFSSFFPLIAVAFIYWVIVTILTKGVSVLERRLRKSDNR